MEDFTKKYFVSLDAVDLSLLPSKNITLKQTEDSVPLWSKKKLYYRDHLDYFQFEVRGPFAEINCTDCCCEFDTHNCYICDLKIPEPYMKQHIDSDKHKMYANITYIASQRSERQISQNCCLKSVKVISSNYFCETCVTVVSDRCKPHHANSKFHENAVEKEAILRDFVNIYNNEKLDDDVNVTPAESEKFDQLYIVPDESFNEKVFINHCYNESHSLNTDSKEGNAFGPNNSDVPRDNSDESKKTIFISNYMSESIDDNTPHHLKSKFHEDAVKKEAILQDYSNIYTNEVEKLNDNMKLTRNDESTNENDSINDGDYESHSMNSDLKEGDAELSDLYLDTNLDNSEAPQDDSNDDNEAISSTVSTNMIESKNDRYYIIRINDDCDVKLKFDNYHGINKISRCRYQCMLCMDTFKRKQRHLHLTKHVNKISLAVKDRHCIRQLNAFKSHCIICNELITNDDVPTHIISNEIHRDLLTKAITVLEDIAGNCESSVIDEHKTLEVAGDIKSQDNTKELHKKHLGSELKSELILDIFYECVTPDLTSTCAEDCNYFIVINDNNLDKVTDYPRHNTYLENEVHCFWRNINDFFSYLFCNVPVTLQEIEDDVNVVIHHVQYLNFLESHHISITSEDKMFCELCNMFMSKGKEICHAYSDIHTTIINRKG